MVDSPAEAQDIDGLLVVTIRVRVAGVPTFLRRDASGSGYTLDNMLARDVCEQELEINLGPGQELITVLGEMAEAVQYERLYGWMAQYRANLSLGAGEIAPEAEAHLYPVSAEVSASLKQREPRELRENQQPAEQGHPQGGSPLKAPAADASLRVVVETIQGERLWERADGKGMTSDSYREDGTLASIIAALGEAIRQACGELAGNDAHAIADVGAASSEIERDVPPAVVRHGNSGR